ncbi:transcriptional regulator [Heyndrickxia sporothermodurans]|nr:transcriptional regulator [Heyndrickxia sporothermodurans]
MKSCYSLSFKDRIKKNERTKTLMSSITQKMLTQQFRELEEDVVIHRKVYNQVPPKVEYSLMNYDWSLGSILDSLCSWGECHLEKNGNISMLVTADK